MTHPQDRWAPLAAQLRADNIREAAALVAPETWHDPVAGATGGRIA